MGDADDWMGGAVGGIAGDAEAYGPEEGIAELAADAAAHIISSGFGLVSRGFRWLSAEDLAGRQRMQEIRPEDRPPEALEPGPLAGPDAEPENAHRVNGVPAAAVPGMAGGTAEAAGAGMTTVSMFAFGFFLSLAFMAGFGTGSYWYSATTVSGDGRAVAPVANAPKFKVTFNVEGSNAEDLRFKLNVVSDPVKPPPSSPRQLPGSSVVRSLSEQVANTARFAYSLFGGMGSSSGGSGCSSSGTSGSSGSGGGGGGSEWPVWDFLCSISEQAAKTTRLAYSFLGRMTFSSSSSGSSSSSSSDKKSSPSTRTDGGKRTGPFKAFTSWGKKHRDAAEDFVDGPGV